MFEVVSYQAGQYDAAVKLKIDLSLYIKALEKYIQNHAHADFLQEVRVRYNEVFLNFHGVNGALLWEQIVSELFNFTSLTDEMIANIKGSALFVHLSKFAGIEIVKNTADECLYRFFSPHEPKSIYTIDLCFKLKINGDSILLDIHDTGRGFPDDLLLSLSNTEGLCDYLLQGGSYKNEHPVLALHEDFRIFGGCGIGLRELIAHIKFNESFATINKKILGLSALPAGEKLKILSALMDRQHQLLFLNSAHGAEIKISMPIFTKQPAWVVGDGEATEQKMMLQSPGFFRFLRKRELPSEKGAPPEFCAKS